MISAGVEKFQLNGSGIREIRGDRIRELGKGLFVKD